jgi:hypothetical protein
MGRPRCGIRTRGRRREDNEEEEEEDDGDSE